MIDTIEEIRRLLQPVFQQFHVRQATLFGSYAKGNMSQNSDIDLVVDSGLVGLDFVELLDAVTNALNKDVDMIDVTHLKAGSALAAEIQKTGVPIFP